MFVLRRLLQGPRAGAFAIRIAVVCAAGMVANCKSGGGPDQEDAGGPPPNNCATREAALNNPQCQLTLGQTVTDYIRAPNDQVWYSIQMPATVDPRTLVQVTAGYGAPSSPVNLGVNLLNGSDGSSLGRLVDNHSQGAPRPVNFIVRYAVPNGRLLVILSDQSSGPPNFDVRNPFSLTSQAIIDPDPNHPNDVVPTPIALTNQGGILVGANYGYLSTTNEVDKFSVAVPPFSGRKIIYVHVAANTYNPPVPYLLSYQLFDPAGVRIAEDHVANEFLAPNMATARLSTSGTYTIVIQGYRPSDSTSDVPGDLRARFDVDVKIMDDVDVNEPNDTIDRSVVSAISLGGNATRVGRLSYVGDNDWFAFDLAPPSPNAPTVIHYQLTPLSTGGRFPPIPKPFLQALAREVRVFTQVTGQPDNVYSCKTDATICPKGYEPYNEPWARLAVETFCQGNPVLCLQGSREESVNFANLKNFEGVLHIPPHTSTLRYFFVVRDAQDNWADDKDYQLFVEYLNDTDEASFYSGGVKQTRVVPLFQAPVAGFPTPPSGATRLNGTLSYGYGRWSLNQVQSGQGLRAEGDYDSIITDTDRYELDFPGSLTTPPLDQSWELQWQVAAQSSGASSYDLALELQFCDGDSPDAGSGCVVVDRSSRGSKLTLSYTPLSIAAWHNPSGPFQRAYDRGTPPDQTVLARAYGCFCFEPRFVRGGKFFMNVSAVDRNSYLPARYQVLTAFTSYPQSYPVDGGSISCPPTFPDGGVDGGWGPGCQFTRQ
jgi:hypothetical protein